MEKTLTPRQQDRGVRFAPSPTGRFHLGNLRTAWISHEWARGLGEPWVLRFEDIDVPRVLPGAREQQLADMEALGLKADQILVQSSLRDRHWETFARAAAQRRVYPCYCSRKDVREALEGAASAPHLKDATYSGRCRMLRCAPEAHGLPTLAWRFAAEEDASGRSDFIVGRSATELDAAGLPRDAASFAPAYHWACAVDDFDGGYRLLVRAADLAEVAVQHRAIMSWLARSEAKPERFPAVYHTALVTQDDGHRLEKRTRGVTLQELLDGGWSIDRILEKFKASWHMNQNEWQEGHVFAEPRSSMTLRELGFQEIG